mmetsp:Transcript_13514/g.34699  ORF Transcript_13514/g.34699 Transcript_13514/m.34699 type:complete len:201 (-) Transcript_13514:31-633(-)
MRIPSSIPSARAAGVSGRILVTKLPTRGSSSADGPTYASPIGPSPRTRVATIEPSSSTRLLAVAPLSFCTESGCGACGDSGYCVSRTGHPETFSVISVVIVSDSVVHSLICFLLMVTRSSANDTRWCVGLPRNMTESTFLVRSLCPRTTNMPSSPPRACKASSAASRFIESCIHGWSPIAANPGRGGHRPSLHRLATVSW